MWQYEKKLQYPVKIKNPNPALAKVIVSQLGGADCKNLYLYLLKKETPLHIQRCFFITYHYNYFPFYLSISVSFFTKPSPATPFCL